MIGNIQSYIGAYTQAMGLRVHRQQVLASNIANADTPYYKARDFDFKAAFAQARSGKAEDQLRLERTHAQHLRPTDGNSEGVRLQYRTEHQSAVDGNTVDMDVETAQIADNALQYQILAQFLSDKFSGLRTAISSNQG